MISLGVIILFSVYCGAACNDHPGPAPLNPTMKPYAKNVKAVKKVRNR
uniref:Salivary secreted peptide n=1 Tax=Triticum urartu TaxID=4572 RepID=A0A8R7V262_TRIUA